jgi:hypothetical protein
METFRHFNLTVPQKRKVIIWVSGIYGLLLGIISLFVIEIRAGIDTWMQLVLILMGVAVFVVACNAIVGKVLHLKRDGFSAGSVFWSVLLGGVIVLIVTAVVLALLL